MFKLKLHLEVHNKTHWSYILDNLPGLPGSYNLQKIIFIFEFANQISDLVTD